MHTETQITEYTPPVIPQITDSETLATATSILSKLNSQLDEITADKEALTKPINETLKGIRAKYKPIETLLTDAIASIRTNMSLYATAQKALQHATESKILSRVERGTLKVDTAINKINTLHTTLQVNTITEHGTVKFRTVLKYRVINISKVPHTLLQPNDEAIKNYQKENPTNPPAGIKYYTEEQPINYRA